LTGLRAASSGANATFAVILRSWSKIMDFAQILRGRSRQPAPGQQLFRKPQLHRINGFMGMLPSATFKGSKTTTSRFVVEVAGLT